MAARKYCASGFGQIIVLCLASICSDSVSSHWKHEQGTAITKSNITVTNRWLPVDVRRTNTLCTKGTVRDVANTFADPFSMRRQGTSARRAHLRKEHQ